MEGGRCRDGGVETLPLCRGGHDVDEDRAADCAGEGGERGECAGGEMVGYTCAAVVADEDEGEGEGEDTG